MSGGADSDTSPARTPSEGKIVNDAGPAIVSSRPVAALTCATISRRMRSVGGAITTKVTAPTASASRPMPP